MTGSANKLLAALPRSELKRLAPLLERFELSFNDRILEAGNAIRHVYFPESGIISMLATTDADSSVIACLVGREGMAGGLPLFLGAREAPVLAIVQGSGTALRMKSTDFAKECKNGGGLPRLLMGFTYSILVQVLQSTVCYRFHTVEERVARWLLMTGDRMESDEFQMTHDFLANMVGVRRESVTKAALKLKMKNLIRYGRGRMEISNRSQLESTTCQCYAVIRRVN